MTLTSTAGCLRERRGHREADELGSQLHRSRCRLRCCCQRSAAATGWVVVSVLALCCVYLAAVVFRRPWLARYPDRALAIPCAEGLMLCDASCDIAARQPRTSVLAVGKRESAERAGR